MNLRDLEYLVAVADKKNIGNAAKSCHVSQPTLSIQLKKLEDTLGIPLFERSHKSIRLTPAGEIIAARARHITHEAKALVMHAKSLQDPLAGECRLGAFPTLAPYYLPQVLPRVGKALSALRLLLVEDKTERLLAQLQAGQLDAALLALPVQGVQLTSEVLFEEPFLLTVPKTHRLAKAKSVTAEDIREEPLLLLEDGHCMRAQALEVCDLMGLKEQPGFRATSLETLRQMVGAGIGVTLMPECAVTESAQVRYIPFKGAPFTRRIGLVWRTTHPRQELMQRLAALLRRV